MNGNPRWACVSKKLVKKLKKEIKFLGASILPKDTMCFISLIYLYLLLACKVVTTMGLPTGDQE